MKTLKRKGGAHPARAQAQRRKETEREYLNYVSDCYAGFGALHLKHLWVDGWAICGLSGPKAKELRNVTCPSCIELLKNSRKMAAALRRRKN